MDFFAVAFSFRVLLLMPSLRRLLILVSLLRSVEVVLLSSSPVVGELFAVRYGLWVAPTRGATFLFFLCQISFIVFSFLFDFSVFLGIIGPSLGLDDSILFRCTTWCWDVVGIFLVKSFEDLFH